MRQRELAWILYITEGYIANLEHALAVNCVTFEPSDANLVEQMIATTRDVADQVRSELKTIKG